MEMYGYEWEKIITEKWIHMTNADDSFLGRKQIENVYSNYTYMSGCRRTKDSGVFKEIFP